MPYNYIFNENDYRTKLGIQVKNNVLLFDEAHNCEDYAEKAESFNIKHD